MSERAQRRWRLPVLLVCGLAGAVLLLGAGLAGAWVWRLELAHALLVRTLEDQGLGPVALRLDTVEGHHFIAREITLRGGALRLARLELGFSILDLLDRKLDSLTVEGLRLDLERGPDGVLAGGKPLLQPSAGPAEGAGSPLGGITIRSFAVADTAIALHGPDGTLVATLDTTLMIGGDGVDAAALTASLTGPLAGAERHISLSASGMTLTLGADGGLRLGLAGVTLGEAALPWQVRDGAFSIARDPAGTLGIELSGATLRNLGRPALLIPMSVSLQASLKGEDMTFAGTVKGRDLPALALGFSGTYGLAAEVGAVKLALAPITFAPAGLQPQAISPAFDAGLKDVTGRVSLGGELRLDGGKVTSALDLVLGQAGFTADVLKVSALDGRIRITRPWPLATAPRQNLKAVVASGGEQAAIDLTGQVLSPSRLKLDILSIRAAGGELRGEGMEADLARLRLAGRFDVHHLDLAEVTRLIGVEGLAGTGSLDGVLPIELEGTQFALRGGQLRATGPGTLYYRPGSSLPAQIADAGAEVSLTLQALADFHYQTLALELEKAPAGDGYVKLSMTGSNPAVLDNQPFTFNIRIESNFARLAELVLLGLRSAQDLLGRAAGSGRP